MPKFAIELDTPEEIKRFIIECYNEEEACTTAICEMCECGASDYNIVDITSGENFTTPDGESWGFDEGDQLFIRTWDGVGLTPDEFDKLYPVEEESE